MRRRRFIVGLARAPPLLASLTKASMANLYFEELQIGSRSAAGPYLLSKDEIIRFAKQYDPIPRHIDERVAARSVFGGLTAAKRDRGGRPRDCSPDRIFRALPRQLNWTNE
jgi:hypothetical protein